MKQYFDSYSGSECFPDYVIESVEKKNGARDNPIYDTVAGRPCQIEALIRGSDGVILFEPADDPGQMHHLFTTSVRKITYEDDGITFETKNSFYHLKEIQDDSTQDSEEI